MRQAIYRQCLTATLRTTSEDAQKCHSMTFFSELPLSPHRSVLSAVWYGRAHIYLETFLLCLSLSP